MFFSAAPLFCIVDVIETLLLYRKSMGAPHRVLGGARDESVTRINEKSASKYSELSSMEGVLHVFWYFADPSAGEMARKIPMCH